MNLDLDAERKLVERLKRRDEGSRMHGMEVSPLERRKRLGFGLCIVGINMANEFKNACANQRVVRLDFLEGKPEVLKTMGLRHGCRKRSFLFLFGAGMKAVRVLFWKRPKGFCFGGGICGDNRRWQRGVSCLQNPMQTFALVLAPGQVGVNFMPVARVSYNDACLDTGSDVFLADALFTCQANFLGNFLFQGNDFLVGIVRQQGGALCQFVQPMLPKWFEGQKALQRNGPLARIRKWTSKPTLQALQTQIRHAQRITCQRGKRGSLGSRTVIIFPFSDLGGQKSSKHVAAFIAAQTLYFVNNGFQKRLRVEQNFSCWRNGVQRAFFARALSASAQPTDAMGNTLCAWKGCTPACACA